MSLKKVPEQSLVAGHGTLDWENDSTLVDERNRLPNRIKRFLRQTRFYIILGMIIMAAMMSPGVMSFVISAMPWVFRILFAMGFMVFQFVVLYGWLARTRMYTIMPGAEGVSFDDYRGQPELLEQAQQVVMLLRGVKAFEGAGGEPLTGMLLEGPPGTGKTWLAKAISTEAGVPFFYVDTASLQGMFMGTGNMKVAGVYRKARKAAKEYGAAVIFMDEIDSVGSRGGVSRVGDSGQAPGGMGMGSGGLLNTLLIEMSGFSLEHGWRVRLKTMLYRAFLRRNPPKPPKRVLTIGATNRVGALDPALLRPGRFDKKIHVDIPDMQGRRDIIEYYLSKMAHDDSLDPAVLATETVNYTPADIKYLLNEALRYALFAGRAYITYEDFLKAQPEHEMGLRAPLKNISPEAKKRLAYYQAGHALAVRLFLPDHRIARITIIRQGFMMGHVSHYSARESYSGLRTKDELTDRLRVLIAGRAAEIEFCGLANQSFTALMGPPGRSHYSSLQELLYYMTSAGMMGTMGGAMWMSPGGMTPDQAKAIDDLYQRVLQETRQTLRENKHIVEALVALLLEKEELMSAEVRAFFDQYNLFTPDPTVMIDGEEVSILPPTRQQPALSGD